MLVRYAAAASPTRPPPFLFCPRTRRGKRSAAPDSPAIARRPAQERYRHATETLAARRGSTRHRESPSPPTGSVYVADRVNRRVRKIDGRGGMTTVAGDGTGDGIPVDPLTLPPAATVPGFPSRQSWQVTS